MTTTPTARALEALENLLHYAQQGVRMSDAGLERAEKEIGTALRQAAEPCATVEDVRAGFIIWNFDTKMNDLLWHIMNYYTLTLKDCEVCENTGRVEANETGTEYMECTDCPRHKIIKQPPSGKKGGE